MPGRLAKRGVGHAVHQPVIDLVGEHDEVSLLRQSRDLLEHITWHDCAGRVVRIADQQGFGARRDGRINLLDRDPEVLFDARGHRHRHAAGENDTRFVGDEAWLRHNHLIPGIDQRQHGQQQCLAYADGDQDLIDWIVGHTVQFLQVFSQRLSEFQDACV